MNRIVLLLVVALCALPAPAEETKKWTTDPYPLPVDPTGAALAGVEKPVVLLHEGRELRFASPQTVEAFEQEPAKYLEALDKKLVAEQSRHYPLTTCPVSGEPLDAMGKPVERVFGNRLVKLCCGSCVKKFEADPTPFIEKLDAAVIQKQDADYTAKACPVSGGELGTMGEPVRYVFANRLVKLCCEGCVEPFKKDVTEHLSKLPPVKVEPEAEPEPVAPEAPADEHAGHH